MAILKITKYGGLVLRKKAKTVEDLGETTQTLIKNMFETMYAAGGIGLAAPQVGQPIRLAVMNVVPDHQKEQFVIINPKIVKREGKVKSDEGCLSLPGVGGTIFKRSEKVIVEALNEKGLPVSISAEGLLARCLQHEIDHLDGKMILHRTSLRRRFEMMMKIRRLKKEGLW